MNENVQAALIAYKAYQLGRDAILRKETDQALLLTSKAISLLEQQHESEQTLRRRIFYTLIRAEVLRASDPVPDRTKAKLIGERLKEEGCVGPFGLYMNIIEATTSKSTSGNYGDMTVPGGSPVTDSETRIDRFGNEVHIDKVAKAVNLAKSDLTRHQKFLNHALEEVIRLHKLTAESG